MPIDGGEILGQAIGRAVVLRHRSRDADIGSGVEQPQPEPGYPVLAGGPCQLFLSAMSIALVARIAGVHSTVWILAISAGDDQPRGVVDRDRRSTADNDAAVPRTAVLCSRANSVCSVLSPIHQLWLKPVTSMPFRVGGKIAIGQADAGALAQRVAWVRFAP